MFETYLVHIQKNAKHIMVYPLINIRCFYCLLNHKKGSHIVLNGIRGISCTFAVHHVCVINDYFELMTLVLANCLTN